MGNSGGCYHHWIHNFLWPSSKEPWCLSVHLTCCTVHVFANSCPPSKAKFLSVDELVLKFLPSPLKVSLVYILLWGFFSVFILPSLLIKTEINFCPVSSLRRDRTVHHNSGTEVCQHSRRCWPTLSTESAKYFATSPCSPSLVIFYSLPNHSLGSLDSPVNIWNYPILYCQIPIWWTVSGSWGHCPDRGNNNDTRR